jgi:hypothetical protein
MSMVIKKLFPLRKRSSRHDAVGRRDARLSEEITGWAVSALFPIRDVPNMYARFPWRRLRKTRGLVCGMLFAVKLLVVWPFELTWEVIRSSDSGSEPFG